MTKNKKTIFKARVIGIRIIINYNYNKHVTHENRNNGITRIITTKIIT